MKGYLLLSDGTKFYGTIIGAPKTVVGEIVFNTGMTGYQEIVTDPSYFGQIVVLTYPMIGNYGVSDVNQSLKTQARGLVVRDMAYLESNWSSTGSFEDYLIENDLIAIKDIDTRHLTKLIRNHGTMQAQIVVEGYDENSWQQDVEKEPAYEVSTESVYQLGDGKYHVAVMDYGIKKSILHQLTLCDFKLTVFPADTTAEEVLSHDPDGVFLSNGPGDPERLTEAISQVHSLVQEKPVFGICLGHQLIGKAFGCETVKLKYGHRGPNHPVKDIEKNKVFITSQNHGYMISPESITEALHVTHINVNDNTVEGIKHNSLPVFSVQYHPEAAPGPDDSNYLFEEFEAMIKEVSC